MSGPGASAARGRRAERQDRRRRAPADPGRAGELVRLEVGAVAHGGHCVARFEGRVVFVRHALPGEHVVARLTEAGERDRFWRADAVEVLTASPDRVEPRCPVARPGLCGGCDWQHASLDAQRRLKAEVVTEQLRRLGGVDVRDVAPGFTVEPVPGDDGGLAWRTRVRFAVDGAGRAGLRRHRSHEVVPVHACPIAHGDVNAVGVGTGRWQRTLSVEVVTAPAVRTAPAGGPEPAGEPAPAEGPDATERPPSAEQTPDGEQRDTGDVAATAPTPDAQRLVVVEPQAPDARPVVPALSAPASLALRTADGVERVRGRTWLEEPVVVDGAQRLFRITGSGFWQVHPGAAQTLLDAVLAAADPAPGETALDLYCGAGLFTAGLAARVGESGAVTGVESDRRAVADARRSLHDLPAARLQQGRVDGRLAWLAGADGEPLASADVVVLDPPRTGAGRDVVGAICALRPRTVVYVACDPAALARDVATAGALGYRLSGLRAFDLFPMTQHVECVATLVPA